VSLEGDSRSYTVVLTVCVVQGSILGTDRKVRTSLKAVVIWYLGDVPLEYQVSVYLECNSYM